VGLWDGNITVKREERNRMGKKSIIIAGILLAGLSVGMYVARSKQHDSLNKEEYQEIEMKSFHAGTEWGYLRACIDYRTEEFSVVTVPEDADRAISYANRWGRKCSIKDHETDPSLKVIIFESR
jgi:hypothetical protein